jgi:Purple acid Phosphatase, N-terminal domain
MTVFSVISLVLLLVVRITSKSTPGNNATVTQIHLAQGKTSESMTVSWVTPLTVLLSNSDPVVRGQHDHNLLVPQSGINVGSNIQDSIHDRKTSTAKSEVRYGTEANDLSLLASGSSTSYTFNYKKYANYSSGLLHHTFLHGLRPSTTYYYQCGDFSTGHAIDLSGALRACRPSNQLNTLYPAPSYCMDHSIVRHLFRSSF